MTHDDDARHSTYFTIFTKFLMATDVLVRVTVNAPLLRASLVWITRTFTPARTVSMWMQP